MLTFFILSVDWSTFLLVDTWYKYLYFFTENGRIGVISVFYLQ